MYTFVQDKLLFLQKFIQSPKQIGSVIPSSRHLALRMLDAVDFKQDLHIAELGSGTGAITQHLNRITTPGSQVFLFEKDPQLRADLAKHYPGYHPCAEATGLRSAIQERGVDQLDCIISGLPYFNFPQHLRDALMEQISVSLKPNGQFIAFQYSLQMKEQFSRYLEVEAIQWTWMNVPPAFVYICRKRGSQQ
ncbi:rRNA adenine N-6-methyltransferase family protein [Paenibacillus filicis]|uniref:rRNA adenine N-6-methyltransferase family protein n=1 Tax=Paenibacillus filicis TaxID=669464 RepID=A0ABU9DUN9_9BACL